jgi:hypothetical protein
MRRICQHLTISAMHKCERYRHRPNRMMSHDGRGLDVVPISSARRGDNLMDI